MHLTIQGYRREDKSRPESFAPDWHQEKRTRRCTEKVPQPSWIVQMDQVSHSPSTPALGSEAAMLSSSSKEGDVQEVGSEPHGGKTSRNLESFMSKSLIW